MTDVVEEDKITVSKVCQDFRVREDGALASKLQEEEYQKHYIRNKSERKTVRGDVRVAKQTYLEEVKTAQLLPENELEELSMEETDKWLARDLQEKLHEEERKEMERQRRLASKDAQIAKSFQEREKEKYDREWQRRREEEMLGRETQEREHQRIEHEEIDEQTALEMRDARMARELQERERQKYERERERYRHERERERERHRHEREQRRERERERMDGQEMDRQKELEMRDARLARELQEREKQRYDREWQRRREHEMLEEQERRHYRRSTSEPVDSRRTASRPPTEAVAINGHAEPVIHRQSRAGSGRDDKREKRKSSGSNSSGGSVGNQEQRSREERRSPREERIPPRERTPPKEERRSPREERIPPRERTPPKEERRSPREERIPPREQTPPKEERRSPREEQIPPREERRSPKVERRLPREERGPPKEERRYDHGENAAVALPTTENGGGRLEHDRIIMADGTAIHLFEDEDDKQKAVAEEKQKALERERQKALEREKQQALEKERQKALELEKLKKDEEYAKMLQDQERRIVEAERMAAENKRLALEERDREMARQLQREEYKRMQQEKKERQMRRANSIPSDRHSVNLEDPRRLPSYNEAVHRRQLPDLLPGNDPTTTRYSYVSVTSSGDHGSSLEREPNAEVEREKYAAQEEDRYQRPHLRSRGPAGSDYHVTSLESRGSREPEGFARDVREGTRSLDREEKYLPSERDYRDDREGKQSPRDHREDRHPAREDTHLPKDQERSFPVITDFECPEQQHNNHDSNDDITDLDQAVWQTREPVRHSPPSSLERLKDNSQLSARSSYTSSGGNSYDRRSQNSGHTGTPPTREDVWERFDDDDEFYNATGRSSRQMFRSQTVSSAHPTNHESERHMTYNVVENIDPTFRRPRKHSDDDPKEGSTEERTKVMQLIKPQRRRSADKKKSKERKK